MGGVAAADAERDHQLAHVQTLRGEGVVQQLRVRALRRERDRRARDPGGRSHGAGPVDEQHRPPAERTHAGKDLPDRGRGPVDGGLDRTDQVVGPGLQHGPQELRSRLGAVLQHLDGTEVVRRALQRLAESRPVADVHRIGAGLGAAGAQ